MPMRIENSNDQRNIDQGWAWVVAAACMICNFFMNGFVKTFGIFFVEFLDLFHSSSSATSIIYGAQITSFSVAGLIVLAVLTEVVNCRTLVMAGGLAFCLGITASSFAQSLAEAVIFIGLLGGIGQALIYGPLIVMLGKYFDRRRALAIGIAGCGGSLGQLTLPQLIRVLIDTYSFRGALLIFGGLVLNCTLCGSLLRPLSHHHGGREDTQEDGQQTNSNSSETFYDGESDNCSETSPKKHRRKDSNMYVGTALTTPRSLPNMHLLRVPSTNMNHGADKGSLPTLSQLKSDGYEQTSNQARVDRCRSEELLECRYTQLIPRHEHRAKTTSNISSLQWSINAHYLSASLYGLQTPSCDHTEGCAEDNGRHSRTDCLRYGFFNCNGKKILNCAILKDVLFLLLLVTAVLAYVGCTAEVVFIPPHAKENGIPDDQIAILISVMGAFDLVCRVLIGLVADLGWVERYKILMTGLFILGISAHLASLARSFWHFFAISIVYGICGGALPTLMAVVLVDFFGMEMLSRSLGLVFLFQGVGVSVLNPLFGWLRDTTGSYSATFHAIGACLVFAGAALIAVPLFRKWRAQRAKTPDIPEEDCIVSTTDVIKQ